MHGIYVAMWLLAAAPLGIFENHSDVGTVLHAGATEYDAAKRTYTISGSGENMWFATDAFQYAWKKVSGDVTLTATIAFEGAGKEGHRKAVLMIRQSLDADAAYADVARHGDGLTSLQAREEKGANTTEIQSAMKGPVRVRISKRGDSFYIWVAGEGDELHFSGGSMRVPMHDPFYVGLGVCSHDKDVVEKAVFSNVELTTPEAGAARTLYSTVETVPLSGDRRAVYATAGRITGAAWTSDGNSLIFKRDGHLERMTATGGTPEAVTQNDSQEYAGDGKYIYSQSSQGGMLQIWRSRPDGSQPEQVTSGELQNCYPHLSPDGLQMAFLSFAAGGKGVPEDGEVMVRVMSLSDKTVKTVARLTGGRGTLDAPPWSPDGRKLTYISYQRVDKAE
jgi:regulation of enolase protein 1 (concanavalin A-like superfamily)